MLFGLFCKSTSTPNAQLKTLSMVIRPITLFFSIKRFLKCRFEHCSNSVCNSKIFFFYSVMLISWSAFFSKTLMARSQQSLSSGINSLSFAGENVGLMMLRMRFHRFFDEKRMFIFGVSSSTITGGISKSERIIKD